jgi:hypothetical protein
MVAAMMLLGCIPALLLPPYSEDCTQRACSRSAVVSTYEAIDYVLDYAAGVETR